MNFDYLLFQKINGLAGRISCLDKIGIFLAHYFPYLIALAAGIFILFWFLKNKKWKIIFGAVASVFLSRVVITEIIRLLWNRPRPFVGNVVNLLLDHEASGSFPSGHTTFLFALAGFVYFKNKKLGWLFFVVSFISCFARVFSGVHYPADILAGIVIGIVSAWLSLRMFKIEK